MAIGRLDRRQQLAVLQRDRTLGAEHQGRVHLGRHAVASLAASPDPARLTSWRERPGRCGWPDASSVGGKNNATCSQAEQLLTPTGRPRLHLVLPLLILYAVARGWQDIPALI